MYTQRQISTKSFAMNDIDVFISYKREERSLADQVARALKEAGYVAVTDLNIQKATDFGEAIDGMIRAAKVVLVLWTKESAASKWVRTEAIEGHALGKYLGVRVDPVSPNDLPIEVRRNNWLDLSDASLPQGLPAILDEVERLAGQTLRNSTEAETAAQSAEKDLEFYQVVSEIGDVGGFKKYLQLYPSGAYVEDAKAHIRSKTRWYAPLRSVPVFAIITAIGTGVGAYVALAPTISTEPPVQARIVATDAEAKAEIAGLERQLKKVNEGAGILQSDVQDMAVRLQTAERNRDALATEVTGLQSRNKELEMELEAAKAQGSSDAELRALVTSMERQKAANEVTIARLSEDLNAALARTAAEERRNAELEKEFANSQSHEAKVLELQAELAALKSETPKPQRSPRPPVKSVLGMTLTPATENLRKIHGTSRTGGLVITAINQNSNAHEKGLVVGDFIFEASQTGVNSVDEFKKRLLATREAGRKSILLLIQRKGASRFVALSLTE